MKRLLASILLLSAIAVASPGSVFAADCAGVAEYVVSMERALGPYLEVLDAQPPLLELSPTQMVEFAAQTDQVAEAYREISPPPIARDYHMEAIAGMQSWANFLRDAASLGVFTAAILHFGDGNTEEDPIKFNQHQGLLAQRCTDFQPFLVWVNTYPENNASPVASPNH